MVKVTVILVAITSCYCAANAQSLFFPWRQPNFPRLPNLPNVPSLPGFSTPEIPDSVYNAVNFLGMGWNLGCAIEIWNTMQSNCARRWPRTSCYAEYAIRNSRREEIRDLYSDCIENSDKESSTPSSETTGRIQDSISTTSQSTTTTSRTTTERPPSEGDVNQAYRNLISEVCEEDGGKVTPMCKNQVYETFQAMCERNTDTVCLMAALRDSEKSEQLKEEARNCRQGTIEDKIINEVNSVLTVDMPDVCKQETISTARELCSQEQSPLTCQTSIMDDYQRRQRLVNDSAICYFNDRVTRSPFTPINVSPNYREVDEGIQNHVQDVIQKMGTGSAGVVSEAIIEYLAQWCPINRRLLYVCEAKVLANDTKLTELALAGWLAYVEENNELSGPAGPSTESVPMTTLGDPIGDTVPEYNSAQDVFDYLESKLGTDITEGCSEATAESINTVCPEASSAATCGAETFSEDIYTLIIPTAECYYENALSNEPLTPFDIDYTGATIEDGIEDGVIILTEQISQRLNTPYTLSFESIAFDALFTICSSESDLRQCAYDRLASPSTAATIGQNAWAMYVYAIANGYQG